MAQRIVRAKRKIATARIPYRIPPDEELPGRLAGVLAVVYLVFNEGWSASAGDRLVRGELCAEAIRLGRLLARLMPDDPEVAGLLALMLLHDSRRDARVDEHGDLVALDEQDRERWDRGRIREGTVLLDGALRRRRPGPVPAAGGDRVAARQLALARADRPRPDRGALRRARAAHAVAGHRGQPRRRARSRGPGGGRPRGDRPAARRRRAGALRAAARRARRPPRPLRRRAGRVARLRAAAACADNDVARAELLRRARRLAAAG